MYYGRDVDKVCITYICIFIVTVCGIISYGKCFLNCHRSPIMQGNTEQQQLILISQLCGSITPEVWPGVENLDLYNKMDLPKGQKRKVKNSNTRICTSKMYVVMFLQFSSFGSSCILYFLMKVKDRLKPYLKDPYACDLLDKLLILDPSKRCDSDSALNHDFFWTDPMPCDLSKMLAQHTQSMFEYLAPPRRPGHIRHPHHQVTGGPSKSSSTMADSGYQDRVF